MKNYVLYSKINIQERIEVRLLMKVELITLSEVTDIQKRLLPLTIHHPAEETLETQRRWHARID